jgi:hypothetical protein
MDSGGHEQGPIGRDGPPSMGMHHDNLFDENETRGGEHYDLSTGQPIDNSTDDELKQLLASGGYVSDGAPAAELDENDEAAKWLAENDPGGLVP